MASAVRYRSFIWSIFAAAGDHASALAAGDIGVAAVESADLGTGGESAGGGGEAAAIFWAGSNGPRIRSAVDAGGEDCTAGCRSPGPAGLSRGAGAAGS